MKVRVQLRYGQNKPIMALGQSDRHHVRSYTGQAMTPTKVAREDVMPEIPEKKEKKQLPISKTYNSNNWLLLLILRTKEGRKSKLSRKKCSRDFFLDSQVTLVNISVRWKNWEINSANSRINTWLVTFFFRFYNMYLISNQLNKLFRKKVYSAARFRDRPPLLISLDKK